MRVLFLVICICFPLFASSAILSDSLSNDDRVRIYSGFRFGFGGAKQRNTVIFKDDGKFVLNPNIGAVLWVRFKQHTGLLLEANYSLKGIRFKREVRDTLTIYQRRIHYLEFPILFEASLGTKRFTEYIEVGIAPAYIAGVYDQSTKFVQNLPVSTESSEFFYHKVLDAPTKRFDLGILLGAGISVKVGPGLLHGGFRTNIGLFDIYKINRIGYLNNKQRQFNFQLQFGYLWHIKSIR